MTRGTRCRPRALTRFGRDVIQGQRRITRGTRCRPHLASTAADTAATTTTRTRTVYELS
jgi:hypothetical protein